ncbi:hypothetical protein KEJ15_02800 [Candidatus Bathyarchaeota archaeon]|nr:hypothetical protein [Candidatus Bathyarchaeota archaeon]
MIQPVVNEIDASIAKILGLERNFVEYLQTLVKVLAERRISRTVEARPETVKGEEEPRIRPPKKLERTHQKDESIPLDKFMES